jgi:RHS repeat-associated protein
LGNNLTQNFGYYLWNETASVNGVQIGQGGRLKTLSTGGLQNLTYAYDAVGNIKTITNSIAAETNTYGYDTLDRLTSWNLNGATENYSYESATGNLDLKADLDLNYNDAAHKHAVTHIGSTQKYWYDANGNQIKRIVGADTYDLTYDAENRLVGVKKNNVTIATFVYDGDGKRVKSTINGVTTSFVGQHYEVTNNVATKYYFAGASRIAMQTSSTLTYLLTDHLNSTSITTNSTGGLVSELRYKPWGETRFTSGTTPTKYQYTGQFSYESDFGLMFYNARFYDSQLGRFTSADTIVPKSQGVQAYDRYAYVSNNPLRYTDPTGHCAVCAIVGGALILMTAAAFTATQYEGTVYDVLGVNLAEKYIPNSGHAMNTYVAGGTAVQGNWPIGNLPKPWDAANSGLGLAQVSRNQLDNELGMKGANPFNPNIAVQAMYKRISSVTDKCNGNCSSTDIFIAAALAQNGPGFTDLNMRDLINSGDRLDFDPNNPGKALLPWKDWLANIDDSNNRDYYKFMIKLFKNDVVKLGNDGWYVPDDIDWNYIDDLSEGGWRSRR